MTQPDFSLLYEEIWRSLSDAAGDASSALRLFALATSGQQGASARMVVLRAVDAPNATIYFCTDVRSGKVRDIARNSHVSALFFEAARARQYRLSGRASLHSGDKLACSLWNLLSAPGRALMMSEAAPGAPLTQPTGVNVTDGVVDTAEPAPNFAAVAVAISEIDYFDMSASPFRRALLSISGPEASSWIQP